MSSSSLNVHASPVAVLVSVRIDPVSGRATRSRADAAGAALALQALQARATLQGRSHAAQPRLLHAACRQTAMPEAVARDYLALGIDRLERLELADADPEHITAALAEACHGLRRPFVEDFLDMRACALRLQAQRVADEVRLRFAVVQGQVEFVAEVAKRVGGVARLRVGVGINLGHANLEAGRPSHSSAVPW